MALVILPETGKQVDRQLIEKSLEPTLRQVTPRLDPYEYVQKVVVAKAYWTVDNNMTMPTLKIRRIIIEA